MRRSAFFTMAVLFMLVGLVACGGSSSSPSAPSGPTIPAVSGNYYGTVNMAFPETGEAMNCPTSTVVTQSGSTVSIAPMVLGGQCGNVSFPFGQMTIDSTGSFESGARGSYSMSCGTYNWVASGGFFGRELRFSMNCTFNTCYNFNLTIVLSR
jgi:ABC-type phosphate transport system substrate-binding protein